MDYNNDFRYDLKVGQGAENELGELLEGSKIEVKHDLHAHRTGNVFVEYESRGKASGVSISEASHYAFVLKFKSTIIIETERLKGICRKYLGTVRDVKGGDSNTSKGILLPLTDLLL